MYTVPSFLLLMLCHLAERQYVPPQHELHQYSFTQEDLMKITPFKISHAVCNCKVVVV